MKTRLFFLPLVFTLALVCLWLAAFAPMQASAAPEACVAGPHSGTINASQEWCAADNPHIVNGSVTVAAGVTLTLEAGVEVRFSSNTNLDVYGTLAASGTLTQPITFTASTPAPGSWRYLWFRAGSHGSLAYCDLAYAGQSNSVALYVDASDVTLSNCAIHDNVGDAIQLRGTGLAPILENLNIADNSGRAVYQTTVDMTPQYNNLSVSGNGTDAIVSPASNFSRDVTLNIAGTTPEGNIPYIWNGPVDVNTGFTLTIDPGVELRFASGFDLEIQNGATLIAEGMPTQPITFTTTVSPAVAGSWRYFWFHSGSHGSLAYCDLAYAGQGNYPALYVDSSDVSISQCAIHDNLDDAFHVRGVGLSPTLENLTIADNSGRAVYQSTVDMTPHYSNLSVSGNGTNAIVSPGSSFNCNATLNIAGSTPEGALPYIWLGAVDVNTGFTLTIDAGVELRFASGFDLEIQNGATLIAEGMPTQPITFTTTVSPAVAGSWRYFWFHSGSHASLSYCDLAYAGQGNYPALYVDSSDVQISDSNIHDNLANAILLQGAGLAPTLQNLTIADNGGTAIYQNTVDMIPVYSNLSVSGNGTDAIVSPGNNFSRDATLNIAGTTPEGVLPYIWLGAVDVNTGHILTIDPGVELRFASGFDLEIQNGATLIAEGTPAQPIIFTPNSASPAPGSWRYFWFHSGSQASLSYCDLAYAGQGNYPALYVDSSDVFISQCAIHDSLVDAIHVRGAGLSPTLENLTIADNSGRAVYQNTVDMTPHYSNMSVSGNGTDAIVSPGSNFSRNATISVAGAEDGGVLPYIWLGAVDVNTGNTLTIDPGVELRFASGFDLEIQNGATLIAEGTPTQPITFTTTVSPAVPGSWRYFWFHSGSHASLAYCDLAYAGQYNYPALYVDPSDVQITLCRIHYSLDEGLEVRSAAQPLLRYNRIENNAFGLRNTSPAAPVDARYNWWGDASGPYHAVLNPGGLGNAVSDGVLFDPWLGPFEYFWLEPAEFLLHGVETLGWMEFAALPSPVSSVEIQALGGGQTYPLGEGLPRVGELDWETGDGPDGLYELHAIFRDAAAQIIADIVKSVAVNNSPAVVWHGGRLDASETWAAGVVHVVEENLYIPGGITLTVQAGAVVKFERGVGVTVEDSGVLDAPATPAAPIVFTALTDDTASGDTNLDGDASTPLPGDWNGVNVQGAGVFLWNDDVALRYLQTAHSGNINADETWAGFALHRITGDVTVASGVTLTIQPGAVIKFETPAGSKLGITVNSGGALLAEGNVAQPIVFTSIHDDAYGGDSEGDGDDSTPTAGDWRWLHLNGGQAAFDHVIIAYGGGTASGNWDQTGVLRTSGSASLTLSNSILRDAFFDGVLAWGGPVTIENSLITGADRGICAHPGSTVTVVNSTVDGNRIGLLLHGGALNVVNTLSSHNSDYGILHDYGSANWTIRYSDFWNPAAANYGGIADQTGLNGNLAEDPFYRDRQGGDYRLGYLSPVIDAADGGAAPESDFMGAPRYDDPRSPNSGLPTPSGAYPDMGAFEFVETADSPIDLVVSAIIAPANLTAGEVVTVEWTVTNAGPEAPGEAGSPESDPTLAVGPWHDSIVLVLGPDANSQYLLAAEVLVGEGLTLGPGESAVFSAQVRVPGGAAGEYRWQVTTNVRGEVFEGQNSANNALLAPFPVELTINALPVGGSHNGIFPAVGAADWLALDQGSGEEILLTLDTQAVAGRVALYAAAGRMPTAQDYAARSAPGNTPDVELTLPAPAAAQTVYLLLVPEALEGENVPYTLSAQLTVFELRSIGLAQAGNAGAATIPLYGSRFTAGLQAELRLSGTTIPASQVLVENSGLAQATFDLTGASQGLYDVAVSQNGDSDTLHAVFTVVTGRGGELLAQLILPENARLDRPFIGSVVVQNTGDADLPAPLIIIEGDANHRLWAFGQWENEASATLSFLAVPETSPSGGVLRPGETVVFYFHARSAVAGVYNYHLSSKPGDSPETVDWATLAAAIRPENPGPQWDAAWQALTAEVGDTYTEYIAALAQAYDEAIGYRGACNCLLPSRLARQILGYMIQRQIVQLPANLSGSLTLVGEPLAQATLLLANLESGESYATQSWLDGAFAFHNAPAGVYALWVSGYAPSPWGEVTLPAAAPLAVEVVPAGRLSGSVVAPGGSAIPYAAVTVRPQLGERAYSGIAAANGYYQIGGIVSDTYEIEVSADGYQPLVIPNVEIAENATLRLNFTLARGGALRGRILDPLGEPVAGATVLALWQSGLPEESYTRSALTSSDGYYIINGLRFGAYDVLASAEGFGAATLEGVAVNGDWLIEVSDLSLFAEAVVQGVVTDADSGLPIAGAQVWSNAVGEAQTTDASGAYTLDSLPPVTMTVRVEADGYQPQQAEFAPATGQHIVQNFELTINGYFSGVVQLAADGSPLTGVPVVLENPLGFQFAVQSGADGQFGFSGLWDGEYAVIVGDGLVYAISRYPFTITNTQNAISMTLALDAAELSGQTLAADGTTPITNTVVGLVMDGALVDTAFVDAQGEYRFLVFQSGVYDLVAWGSQLGLPRLAGVNVTIGQHLDGQNLLAGSGQITVNVAAQGGAPLEGAAIRLQRSDGGYPADASLSALTDAVGQAVFSGLALGEYRITVSAAEMATEEQTVTLSGSTASASFTLEAGLTLQGTLEYASGEPAAQALVTAIDATSGDFWLAFSEADGGYRMDRLPQGVYRLWFSAASSAPLMVEPVYVWGPGATVENALLASPGVTLTGVISTASGAPVWGATVSLADASGLPLHSAQTDQFGNYTLERLPSGEQTIQVNASGFETLTGTVILPGSGSAQASFTLGAALSVDLPPASGAARQIGGRSPDGFLGNIANYARFLEESWSTRLAPPEENGRAQELVDELNGIPEPNYSDCPNRYHAYLDAQKAKFLMQSAYAQWRVDYLNFKGIRAVIHAQAITQATIILGKIYVMVQMAGLQAIGADTTTAQFISTLGSLFTQLGNQLIAGDFNAASLTMDIAGEALDAAQAGGLATGLSIVGIGLDTLNYMNEIYNKMPKELNAYITAYNQSKDSYLYRVKNFIAAMARFKGIKNCEEDEEEPPEPQPVDHEDDDDVDTVISVDPNDKVTIGYGSQGFIAEGTFILYTIHFENMVTATVAAQQVIITDILPTELDWATLELVAIGFNDVTLNIPAGLNQYETTTYVATDPNPVQVQVAFDPGSGALTWLARSLDPVTGAPPEDPLAGFLPPNDESGRGEGYVIFAIQLQAGLADGTTIANDARIVFDVNPPIDTNTALNTLDSLPPASSVQTLPAQSLPSFTVAWAGSDSVSGIAGYDVFVAVDGGPFVLWQEGVSATQAVFTGEDGHVYSFYSVAQDNVGHREAAPTSADTSTTVVAQWQIYLPVVRK